MRQRIRYLTTEDGSRLAWAEAGRGAPLLNTGGWLSRLEYGWQSPIVRHWLTFFAERFRLIRHDLRGYGLSERAGERADKEPRLDDFVAVAAAADASQPFTLLGVSQGAASAIRFAAAFPERVSALLLYGGYSRGWDQRGDSETERRYRAILELTELCWDRNDPAFQSLLAGFYIPDGTPEQASWLNEWCRRSFSARAATNSMRAAARTRIEDVLGDVSVPTLVIHADGDQVVPIDEGRRLASGIEGSEFVQLNSRNHILLAHEPAWKHFQSAVCDFTARHCGLHPAIAANLSTREREILAGIADGMTNREIGAELFISEKTVRNTVTRVLDKLEVRSRTEAAVLARDAGLPSSRRRVA